MGKFSMVEKKLLQNVPETHRRSLQRAVEILQQAGCAQIFLFGSLATGQIATDSDIDLAVRGCPKGQFFHLLGQLILELDHPVDLISLDNQDTFARYLEQEGELIRVG